MGSSRERSPTVFRALKEMRRGRHTETDGESWWRQGRGYRRRINTQVRVRVSEATRESRGEEEEEEEGVGWGVER